MSVVDTELGQNYDGCQGGRVVPTVAAVPLQSPSTSLRHAAVADADAAAAVSNRRPGLIGVRFYKQNVGDRLGVTFGSDNGRLCVRSLNPQGALAGSPLRSGDLVLSVNGVKSRSLSELRATAMVRELTGYVAIHAKPFDGGDRSLATVCAFKSRPDDRLGVTFVSDHGLLRIHRKRDDGVLGKRSIVNPGDYVLAINGLDCRRADPDIARMLVVELRVTVTLLVSSGDVPAAMVSSRHIRLGTSNDDGHACCNDGNGNGSVPCATSFAVQSLPRNAGERRTWQGPDPMYISVTVTKPTRSSYLGLKVQSIGGCMHITGLSSDGLLAESPLREGLQLVSINHDTCTGWTTTRCATKLRQLAGVLHLVARDQAGDANYVQAMATKTTPRSKVGIKFEQRDGRLWVASIREWSLFALSTLNADDMVLAINGWCVSGMSIGEALGLIANEIEAVTILCKTDACTAVVLSQGQNGPTKETKAILNHTV